MGPRSPTYVENIICQITKNKRGNPKYFKYSTKDIFSFLKEVMYETFIMMAALRHTINNLYSYVASGEASSA